MTACSTHSRVRLLALAIGALIVNCWAQAPAPTPETPAPTRRVVTHMVLVDVVVTDKQGKPISGLHPEDFVVEENGKVQKIASLSTPEEKSAPPPALPPGIYSNRPQFRSPGGPITVMLLDAVNTPFNDQAYARGQMLRFVKEQYKPGDRMGIFTLTGSLNVLQDFTSDPQILYAALQRYKAQPQEFASAGRAATSAAGDPTTGSTVASLDASTPPVTGSSGGGDSGLRGGGMNDAAIAGAQAALQAFEGAQIGYAKEQRAVVALNALNSLARILGGCPDARI